MSDQSWEFSPKRLRGHRERLGLSRVELGQRVDLRGDTIKKLELGWLTPSFPTFLSLVESLRISPNDLCQKATDESQEYLEARYHPPSEKMKEGEP